MIQNTKLNVRDLVMELINANPNGHNVLIKKSISYDFILFKNIKK